MARHSTTVDVTIDFNDLNEEDLVAYLKSQGYAVIEDDGGGVGFDIDDLNRVYEAMRGRRYDDAMSLIERLVRPKWHSISECQAAAKVAWPAKR